MKYLKTFNESATTASNEFTKEEIDNIKDIFQDIIDEFDLIESNFGSSRDGQYRFIGYGLPETPGLISLHIWININSLMGDAKLLNKFSLHVNDLKEKLKSENFIVNLKNVPPSMGYRHHLFQIEIKKV